MGQTPDELRDAIESAREDLGQTLGAIGDKVSPKQMARRRMDRAKTGMADLRDRVMGTADDLSDSASSTLGSAGQSGKEALVGAGHSIAETGEAAGSAIAHAPQRVGERTQGNPLAAGLVAFGIGALAASLIPVSRMESEQKDMLKRQVVEPLTDQWGDVKQDVVADLRDSARESTDAIAQTAKSAAQTVGNEAQAGAAHVADEAQTAAGAVKEQATESAQTVSQESGH